MSIQWNAELLRVSLFSNEPIRPAESLWTQLTGIEEAESRRSTPNGGKMYSGTFEEAQMTLQFNVNRVDIFRSSKPETMNAEVPMFPSLGEWRSNHARFAELLEKWISSVDFPMVRMAFGAVLLAEFQSQEDVLRNLAPLTPSLKVDEKMRELIYRINWPIGSKSVDGLMLNRITQWNPAQLITKSIILDEQSAQTLDLDESRHALRLECDVNTDATNTQPFDFERRVHIFRELIELAAENAEKGERP